MSEINNDTKILGLTPSNIKMDLLRFKDDILKDLRIVQKSLDQKYSRVDDYLKERLNKFDLKISAFEKKISELSNLIITDTTIREKVESLSRSEEEIRDTIFKRRALFNEFEKKTKDDIDKISSILTDSVIYPGVIGNNAKFKSFHDFMDFVLQEIAQLCLFKDKSGLDLTPFKKKIDTALDNLKFQMNNFCSKDFVNTSLVQSEERIQSLLKVYDDRLQDSRVENSHYAIGIKKQTEEIQKQMEFLKNFKSQLLGIKETEELFNNYNFELSTIKERIDKINEIIKELMSFHSSPGKNFMKDFERKSSKVYSGVKQYIKGNINANELTAMKRFTIDQSRFLSNEKLSFDCGVLWRNRTVCRDLLCGGIHLRVCELMLKYGICNWKKRTKPKYSGTCFR